MDASYLNVGSLILGLMAWGLPIFAYNKYKDVNIFGIGVCSALSFFACALSLSFQLFYSAHLVNIEDWSALMDTANAVAKISFFLLIITGIINGCVLVLCYKKAK